MIDSYMDRADAATGYRPTPSTVSPISEDPRYFNHQLYNNMINRNVAEAKWRLPFLISQIVNAHKMEIRNAVPLGSEHSRFKDDGKLKKQGACEAYSPVPHNIGWANQPAVGRLAGHNNIGGAQAAIGRKIVLK